MNSEGNREQIGRNYMTWIRNYQCTYFDAESTHLKTGITVNNSVSKSTSCAYQGNLTLNHIITVKLSYCVGKFAIKSFPVF